jgi:hypothetical protein
MDNQSIFAGVVFVFTVIFTLVSLALVLFILSGANTGRIGVGLSALRRALRDQAFADQLQSLLAAPPKEEKPPRPSGVPLRLLALLQREGRLLDFLMEDVAGATDAQLGAGVRSIHQKCQAALKEHLVLESVIAQPEESQVVVSAGFDPSAIRLVGNVTGQPPFRGKLIHAGWRVRELKLAPPPQGQDELVVMPAEVELP